MIWTMTRSAIKWTSRISKNFSIWGATTPRKRTSCRSASTAQEASATPPRPPRRTLFWTRNACRTSPSHVGRSRSRPRRSCPPYIAWI
ncbi:hypothetical protein L596_017521 [Steinernema carpocapsae]|uniref:Uncharacterized protein n=1 Tax=Steinernema carpocapsae TaxID=34508 RepID=A0A4V6A1T9_STECR|nr:hypothetical protein L596_017521 [Steinernema carpocapsae]